MILSLSLFFFITTQYANLELHLLHSRFDYTSSVHKLSHILTYNTHRWLCNNMSFTNQIFFDCYYWPDAKNAFSVASHVNKKAKSNSVYFALNWVLWLDVIRQVNTRVLSTQWNMVSDCIVQVLISKNNKHWRHSITT